MNTVPNYQNPEGIKKLFGFYLLVLAIEFVLLLFLGLLLSENILILGNYSYYAYSLTSFLPFAVYVIKFRKAISDLYEEIWVSFFLKVLFFTTIWLLQLLPFLVFEYALPYVHLNYYIPTTVLSVILTLYLSYTIVIYFVYVLFTRLVSGNVKLLLIALFGVSIAYLFVKSNNLASEFGFILEFDGIFVSLTPVLFNFIYEIEKKDEYMAKEIIRRFKLTEAYGIFSIILLLMAYLINNAIPEIQFIVFGMLAISISFLFSILISIVVTMYKLKF